MANNAAIEHEELRTLAEKLVNGSSGDVKLMGVGISMLLRREAARAEEGWTTPAECKALQDGLLDAIVERFDNKLSAFGADIENVVEKKIEQAKLGRFGWPAAAAVITIAATIAALFVTGCSGKKEAVQRKDVPYTAPVEMDSPVTIGR